MLAYEEACSRLPLVLRRARLHPALDIHAMHDEAGRRQRHGTRSLRISVSFHLVFREQGLPYLGKDGNKSPICRVPQLSRLARLYVNPLPLKLNKHCNSDHFPSRDALLARKNLSPREVMVLVKKQQT
jgi:hypothetical protein